MANEIRIEVAYGLADQQSLYTLNVATGTTARQAVLQSDVQRDYPQADLTAPLGIFGKVVRDDTILRENDRVELYRPLLADPKDARRKRVQKQQENQNDD